MRRGVRMRRGLRIGPKSETSNGAAPSTAVYGGSGFVATLLAMSVSEHMPLAEVKNRLSEVADQVESHHARVTITKHGRPAATLISTDDLTSLEETLALLSDPDVMAQIRASREELRREGGQPLTKDEMLARIRR